VITASATITRGKKSNRVKLVKRHTKRGRPAGGNGRKRQTSVQAALRNPEGSYVIISVSLYPEQLAAMDELAVRVQMTRSAMIRRAVERFAESVAPGAEQAQLWKAALR
jgi:hypothetical protein